MKKIITTIMLCMILVVGIISAGAIGISKTSSIDKDNRDAVLDKSGANEINPSFNVREYEDYILCSGYQEGIINSKDNKIKSYWIECLEYEVDETGNEQSCLNEVRHNYTLNQMDDKCANLITKKIDDYGGALIQRNNPTDTRSGNVEIEEKK